MALCLLLTLFARHGEVAAQQFSFRQYAQTDGLTNLAAGYLLKDPGGDMWVGTDGGLVRFDGTAFVPYDKSLGLPSETVRGMNLDPWGRLWVALDRGLYVGTVAGFQPVRSAAGPVLTDHSLPIAFLDKERILVARQAHVLELHRERSNKTPPVAAAGVATPGVPMPGVATPGLTELWQAAPFFSPGQLEATPDLDKVASLFTERNGVLWLGCGKQLCSVSEGRVQAWGKSDAVPEGAYGAFLMDRDDRLWVRSEAHLLMRSPGTAKFVVNDPPHAKLESRVVEPLLTLDSGGRLLTRTAPGFARWDGQRWQEFSTDNGLADSVIAKAQVDGEGSLWLSALGLGVWRWRGYDNVESWTRTQGFISQKVWNIIRDHDGKLLVGTERGCQMLDEAAARVVACPFEGLPNIEVISLAVDPKGGRWWGLENSELWTIPAHEKRARLVPFPDGKIAVSVIWFDHTGVGWIVCYKDGLYRLDPATSQPRRVELPRADTRIYDITEDQQGTLWVAASGGIFRFAQQRWTFLPIHNQDGSPGIFSSIVAARDGAIWASNFGKGLLRARGTDLEQREWVKPEIIADASVYSLRTDLRGRLWANTDQGVAIFDGSNWLRIDVEDGLAWNDTEAFAFLPDADGSVWIGTAAGMTHIRDPERLLHPQGPLDLRIASARLGDRILDIDNNTAVAWRADAAFDVRFSSRNYSRSPSTEFRYRLLGLSSRWFGSRSPEVHLPALDGGKYELQIMAIDAPHARKSRLVTMAFEVLPPWWRTLSFRLCLAALVALLLTLAWRYQSGKLRARRVALEQEFREREALLERATRDALTGLWNRATILDVLSREMSSAQRTGAPLALAIIDVDHFKLVNDTYGHPGGDEVLRELAQRLGTALRQNDWLGRYGGEELMVVLPGLPYAGAATPIEGLRECVSEEPFALHGFGVPLTVSIGTAWCESANDTVHAMISRADSALYAAKASGRNRVVYPRAPADPSVEATGSRPYLVELRDRLKREVSRPRTARR
ncbi:MAG: putative sensor protein [Gammaproteobacteria bacterium]|nr:putative sensor protein [Gammaproteobacteria bacterium]